MLPYTSAARAMQLATLGAAVLLCALPPAAAADVDIPKANGENWEGIHTTPGPAPVDASGAIKDVGEDGFDDFGMLVLQARVGKALAVPAQLVTFPWFTTSFDGWDITSGTASLGRLRVQRSLHASEGTDHIRVVDALTNAGSAALRVDAAWGGNLGSDANTVVVSSSAVASMAYTMADDWTVTIQCLPDCAGDPLSGPGSDSQVGVVWGDGAARIGTATVRASYSTAAAPWIAGPSPNPFASYVAHTDDIGAHYRFTIAPHRTVRLMYFAYSSLSESATAGGAPNVGFPGEQVALAIQGTRTLARSPDTGGMTVGEQHSVVNWRLTTDAADHITGSRGDDLLNTRGGADSVRGAGGSDTLCGGSGRDHVYGDAGDDWVSGGGCIAGAPDPRGRGDDASALAALERAGERARRALRDSAADVLVGGTGDDHLAGGDGDDHVSGGPGDDAASGGRGNDRLHGGPGRDLLSGGPGDDRVAGDAGNDLLVGRQGDDTIIPGPGRDTVVAGSGDDTVDAAGGDADVIDCGAGTDTALVDASDRTANCEHVLVVR